MKFLLVQRAGRCRSNSWRSSLHLAIAQSVPTLSAMPAGCAAPTRPSISPRVSRPQVSLATQTSPNPSAQKMGVSSSVPERPLLSPKGLSERPLSRPPSRPQVSVAGFPRFCSSTNRKMCVYKYCSARRFVILEQIKCPVKRLSDFGIAFEKALDRSTCRSRRGGTPENMPKMRPRSRQA